MTPTVINSLQEAIKGIENLQGEMGKMGDRLSMARAWYAYKDQDGNWIFGPSKFIGYSNLTVEDYLAHASNMDGRRTEARLQDWFSEVPEDSDLHEKLFGLLSQTIAKYGKSLSKKARINVLLKQVEEPAFPDLAARVAELIVAVSKMLPAELQNEIKRKL